ncbi:MULTISPECIES: relaxase/mobilization nuclease domain-containing protein [Hymenobacter]|uniref:Relaxase/Mobilisation nuclease domain-containing protein n=1 Tax=Hymenobacter mucosus TaxID=1411120 RepID=A0A239AWL0_9BACT|nr:MULTISPECIES: relaxase/mobilization nuclease domain-containing protein [Hymenobacter]MDF7815508.1 relaxase/mobilization nuclease domain-containing protein [Hymenobacter sp. YC55]SNR99950.1 Relaxase/Mobilisation nuclease domain-containing protein [Hymenobacter mucosus]
MIAKTVTGSDFEGALLYGAGLRRGKGKEPEDAPLLVVSNVIPGSPKEMAEDMQATAAISKKIQKPVWHTVLSWKADEVVTQEQKVAAARRYCELIGAPIDRHQVVVYEHRDKQHAHVHIYLNRVPIDGGPALRTDNNFYRQPAITKQISQELGMQPIPERRQSLADVDPIKQATRELVREAVKQLVAQPANSGPQWLQEQLEQRGIATRYRHDKGGILRGVSFELEGVAVTGQQVGFKAAQLREMFPASQQQVPTLPTPSSEDEDEAKTAPKQRPRGTRL